MTKIDICVGANVIPEIYYYALCDTMQGRNISILLHSDFVTFYIKDCCIIPAVFQKSS